MIENLKNLHVLFAEDDKEIQENLKKVLEFFFAKVYTADDGVQALKVMQEESIHIVFTDYEMPNLNGYNLIKKIRSQNKTIPIIVISNHDDREKLQACMPLNLSAYLFKPLTYQSIKSCLESLADKLIQEGQIAYTFSTTHSFNLIDKTLREDKLIHQLTKMEFLFLELLIRNRGKVVTLEEISNSFYKLDPSSSTIKNIVYRLKKKYNFNYIENITHIGYKLSI